MASETSQDDQEMKLTLQEIEEQLAVIAETAGAWTDEDHLELRTEEDIDKWLQNVRAS